MMMVRGNVLSWLTALFLLTTPPFSLAHGTSTGGYKLTDVRTFADGLGLIASLQSVGEIFESYGSDVEELRLTVLAETNDRLHVHITDKSHSRWEIPQSVFPRENDFSHRTSWADSSAPEGDAHTFGTALEFSYISHPFGFAVTRPSTGEVLFNCTPSDSTGGSPAFNSLVFKDQYLEISTQLQKNSVLFGLGESTRPEGLRLVEGKTYTLWTTDIGSNIPDVDLYGAFPFYMEVKKGGSAHGVLLLNSNGMDILYAAEHLTYRVIGGIFDFYFFAGSTPLAVVDQYTQLAGRPAPMPYWALGFHQCRWGYKNVEDLEGVVAGYAKADIPLEVMWSDIDYMDNFKDFTVDPVNYPEDKLRAFVDSLHKNHQKYVLILDPGIAIASNYTTFQRLVDLEAYIKNQNGDPFLAQVWPGPLYYPDFLHPNIQDFWGKEIELFHSKIPFDGLWCDMNEASNFCSGLTCHVDPDTACPLKDFTVCCLVCNSTLPLSPWDDPPYKINCSYGAMYGKTIALSAKHFGDVREYDAHNLYGLSEVIVTRKSLTRLTGKRPFILSRSTFVGSGAHTAHWTGDNQATWADLAYSITSVLNSGLVGVPMVGADICGFQSDTWEELCNRWIQLGAFYPFARDHSDRTTIRQELYLWDSVAHSARVYLGIRYQLLPYYYSLLFEAHSTGAPVVRPLFFEFPDDPVALDISAQFLVGSCVLVSPALAAGATSVRAYFPKGSWYSLLDLSQVIRVTAGGEYRVLPAPLDTINVHLREGSIVPMQGYALTTAAARKTPFTLLVVFSPEEGVTARGQLFLDDGDSLEMRVHGDRGSLIEFSAVRSSGGDGWLRSAVTAGEFALKENYRLEAVKILGLGFPLTAVRINGVKLHPSSLHIQGSGIEPFVELSSLSLNLGNSFEMSWECSEAAYA